MTTTYLSGWGRSTWALTDVRDSNDNTSRAYIARGLGRSYGDCAAISGGTTLLHQGHTEIRFEDDIVVVGASVTLENLLSASVKRGLFLPVSPGTRYVSIGGAIAADVHGKNHHHSGSIGNHVIEILIALPNGEIRCSRDENSDVFWATVGGMGLTGIILEASLRLKRVSNPFIQRRDLRIKDFNELIDKFEELDHGYEYSVAWIDTLAKGKSFGRGVMTLGNHERDSNIKVSPIGKPPQVQIRKDFPQWLLNEKTMRIFNEVWYRVRPRDSSKPNSNPYPFFYPLDSIGGWNHVYGRRGFIQYQFVVPPEKIETLQRILKTLSNQQVPVFLSVLKRFGPGNSGYLSFPLEGWTLSVDIPTNYPRLNHLLDDFDDLVIAAGGRVYLAKDSRLSPRSLKAMYPRLESFLDVRRKLRVLDIVKSDLSVRLSI